MPIYEYRCRKCGKEFEAFQGIADPAIKSCKFCRGSVRKLMSLSSFQLKGSGWYATDYGGKKSPAGERKKEETKATETGKISSPAETASEE
jgi:putative FmdB family regulatory protein